MEPQAFPPSPIFPSIREATTQDINRMAELSVLAFQDSEIFRFVRPGCNKYPWDTVASFVRFWRSQLRNPRVVVLVSEDWKLLGERRVPCPCSKQVPRDSLGLLNERVVVGVCSWRFPSGSRREGQFACLGVGDYKAPKSRDLDPERSQALDSIRLDAEQKLFAGMIVCNTVVVHPSYQRRRHAYYMLDWGRSLSDIDRLDQGAIPSHAAEKLFASLGFTTIDVLQVPDTKDAKGFHMKVAVYKANSI